MLHLYETYTPFETLLFNSNTQEVEFILDWNQIKQHDSRIKSLDAMITPVSQFLLPRLELCTG